MTRLRDDLPARTARPDRFFHVGDRGSTTGREARGGTPTASSPDSVFPDSVAGVPAPAAAPRLVFGGLITVIAVLVVLRFGVDRITAVLRLGGSRA
ncbi:hypothetical protein [Saccharothrix hoggarensis]|uniref:Uncharacterized protein n=1 Tax=Saccharothrix hoggarensis TaxID=913853 RepID=A0ABW3QQ28_9PSEU